MYGVNKTTIDYNTIWRMIWLVCKDDNLSLGTNIYNKLRQWNLRDATYDDNCVFFRNVLDFIEKYQGPLSNDPQFLYLYRVFGVKMDEFCEFIEKTKIKKESFCRCGDMWFDDWDYRCRYPIYEVIHDVEDVLIEIKKWKKYFKNKPPSLFKTKTITMMSDTIPIDCVSCVLDYLW
jgi:hypothetical protein